MSDLVSIPSHDAREFKALSVAATQANAPGLVLVQEIFGINSSMEAAAQHWASQGYHVVCPDLFWRQQPGGRARAGRAWGFRESGGLDERHGRCAGVGGH